MKAWDLREFNDREGLALVLEDGKDTSDMYEIIRDVLPGVMETFAQKSADYPSGNAFVLGKKGLWDEEPLAFERTEEICGDLIGHLLLTLLMLKKEKS
jgi:hypothetical protein